MPDLPEYLKEALDLNLAQINLLFSLLDCTSVDNLTDRKTLIKMELDQLKRNIILQSTFLIGATK